MIVNTLTVPVEISATFSRFDLFTFSFLTVLLIQYAKILPYEFPYSLVTYTHKEHNNQIKYLGIKAFRYFENYDITARDKDVF